MMPHMDGYELLRRLKSNEGWRTIPFVFLTAKGRDVDIAKGMVLGADEYITKPFSNQQIVACVKKLLDK